MALHKIVIISIMLCLVRCQDEPEGLGIDEIIKAASSNKDTGPLFNERTGDVIVELDIAIGLEDYQRIYEKNEDSSIDSNLIDVRKGVRESYGGLLWPNAVIPYEIRPNTFSYQQKSYIQYAMDEWMRSTCITFRRADYNERQKVVIQNGNGCWSTIGMQRGYNTQYLTLAPNCRYKSIILHELGHVIGFFHEHTRPDRDDYVYIVNQNIQSNMMYNFKKYSWSSIDSHGVPYDYESIMHYSKAAFSSNGGTTISTNDRSFQNRIGNYRRLSFRDIKAANRMYQCKPNWCKYNDKDCPGEGFIGKDCKCWCPGSPYRYCDFINEHTTTTTTTTSRPTTTYTPTNQGGCTDKYKLCKFWASKYDKCQNSNFVRQNCKWSCNNCSPLPPAEPCKDTERYCGYWYREGYCNLPKYKWYLAKNCKKSCGVCSSRAYLDANDDMCQDDHPDCAKMASRGDCFANQEFMMKSCKATCSFCE